MQPSARLRLSRTPAAIGNEMNDESQDFAKGLLYAEKLGFVYPCRNMEGH